MEKCTFCVQRIRRAEERALVENRPLRDGEVVPACVQTCPPGALVFGDLNDPDSRVTQLIANNRRAFRLLEHLGTEPSVYYLKGGASDGRAT
jgi:molybdopterin-containing oxidoreductase family iron-sulfur binding subunit